MVGSGVSHLSLDNTTQKLCGVQVRPVSWPSNTTGAKIPLNCIAGDGALCFIKFRINTANYPEIFVLPYVDKLNGNYDILSQKHMAPPTEPKLLVTGAVTMALLGQLICLT